MPMLEVDGRTLFYLGGPSGMPEAPALVCIHGAGGSSAMWPQTHVAFRADRSVYALDLPGHGRSTPLDGEVSLERYAETVVRFLDAAGLSRVVLAGHSMGGALAQLLALEAPERVAGLALVATGARLGVAPDLLDLLDRDPAAAAERICRLAYGPAAPEEMVRRGIVEMQKTPDPVLRGDFAACQRFDVRARLGAIRAATLVVVGEVDVLTPPRFARFLAERIAGSDLVLVPGAGHMLPVEAPGPFAAAMRPFLERL